MRLIAFVGTSLGPDDVAGVRRRAGAAGVDLDLRPPVIRGDLLGILAAEPTSTRVLILDGEFGQRLSVSVTEIREYLATGRYLAGGSSMGALRAVECRILGMRQHGWVAASYLDGSVCADDEVALLFDPDSHEAVTVPLINVRWLARTLRETRKLPAAAADDLVALAAAMHYRTRTPAALGRRARQELPRAVADLLVAHLDPAAVPAWDRKRLDALDALGTEIDELGGVHVA